MCNEISNKAWVYRAKKQEEAGFLNPHQSRLPYSYVSDAEIQEEELKTKSKSPIIEIITTNLIEKIFLGLANTD